MVFRLIRQFPIRTRAAVQLGRGFLGGRLELRGTGDFDLSFSPTANADLLDVRLHHVRLTFEDFSVGHAQVSSLNVHALTVETQDFEDFGGSLSLKTGEAHFEFDLRLDPGRIPELRRIGVRSPVTFHVVENGRIDLDSGLLDTRTENTTIGPLGFLDFIGEQWGLCETSAQLCVSTLEGSPGEGLCKHEVQICPGESVVLSWSVAYAESAEIDPDIGVISVGSSSQTVTPESDTTYTLQASGSADRMCKRTSKARVLVVSPGDEITLSAAPDLRLGIWTVVVAPETTSSNIMITSIKSTACGFGAPVYPKWAVQKIDYDGTVHHFDVSEGPTSPGSFPLVGTWNFVPIIGGTYEPNANACFEVTVNCRE